MSQDNLNDLQPSDPKATSGISKAQQVESEPMGKTIFSFDGLRSDTTGSWKFTGEDNSKGYRTGKTYKMKVHINHDPSDFFIYTHAKGLAGFRTDDTFYDSHEAFGKNWEEA